MDLQFVKKGFGYNQKRRNWALLLGALGFAGYGVYRAYHLPSMVRKREKLLKLFGALLSTMEAVSDSAEAIGFISKDLSQFAQSDSDQIPSSLRQISKITLSDAFSDSVVSVMRALTAGIMRAYRLESRDGSGIVSVDSSFPDRVLDKLFSTAGSGFASVVVGSFVKNLVMAFNSGGRSSSNTEAFNINNSASLNHNNASELPSIPEWVNLVCGQKCRELIGDCIRLFVSTAVAVYLDKTMHINTYGEIFSGLTNPKHERKMKDTLTSICNGAVETLVKTSSQVLMSSNSNVDSKLSYSCLDAIVEFESQTAVNEELLGQQLPSLPSAENEARKSFNEDEDSGWVNKICSTLAIPSNRKFVIDVSGKVTFETFRYFLECLTEKMYDGMRTSFNVVHEVVVDRGLGVAKYVRATSSAIVNVCVSLCSHVLGGVWVLVPA